MKKTTFITIPSSYVVITTIVCALVATTFFEIDKALGEGENFVVDINDADSDNKISAQELIETPCKSPCPPNAEMCIQMCA